MQLASTEYDGIGARTLNTITSLQKHYNTTLVFMLCFCCRWAQPPAHPKTVHAHLTMNGLETNNCYWNMSHMSPFTCDGSWDKCTFTSGCPVATHAPATSHAITPQSVLSVPFICDELSVFSKKTYLKNGRKNLRRNEIAGVIDCKRMFSLALPDCTTQGTSRNTVRNERHPKKSKRMLQPTSTECDGIGARTTQHAKFHIKTLNTTFVFVLCFCCRWAQPPAHPKTVHAHLTTNWLETATIANGTSRRPTASGTRPIFLRSRWRALRTNAHLLAGVLSQLTHLPHHTQSRLNQRFFIPRGELSFFSTNTYLKKNKKHNFMLLIAVGQSSSHPKETSNWNQIFSSAR